MEKTTGLKIGKRDRGGDGGLPRNRGLGMVQLALDYDDIAVFCGKWRISEFSLFGSVLRDDFGPESDVDVLVSFETGAPWSLWDLLDMREELSRLFKRPVDLIEKKALRNPFRRQEILSTRQVIHASE